MKIENVWPGWQIECEIGRGASGVVYRCIRNDNGVNAYAAIKVITVPKESDNDTVGLDATRMLYNQSNGKKTVDAYVNEIELLEALKGAPNIVSIDDFTVVEEENYWQIFIRMELLTDLRTYFRNKPVTEGEVIKLGKDICAALTLCQRNNIVHRDIKPENIFVSRFGDFKIGDFGIAKRRDNSMGTVSFKGTYNYIAPETVREFRNDVRSDMYSLGLVMYEILGGKLPFVDNMTYGISNQVQKEQALSRRLAGERIPPIYGASGPLNRAILKACSFNPVERFESPEAFARALTPSSTSTTVAGGVPPVMPPVPPVTPPVVPPIKMDTPKKKSKAGLIIGIIAALLVVFGIISAILIVGIIAGSGGSNKKDTDDPIIEVPTASYYGDEDPTISEETTESTTEEITTITTTTTTTVPREPATMPTMPPVTVPAIQPNQTTKPPEPDCKNGHTTNFGHCERCGEVIITESVQEALIKWETSYNSAIEKYILAEEAVNTGDHVAVLQNAQAANRDLKAAIDAIKVHPELSDMTSAMQEVYNYMGVLNSSSQANETSTYIFTQQDSMVLPYIAKTVTIYNEKWVPLCMEWAEANK